MDAFSFRLGVGQGRITDPDGESRFVLGDAEPGWFFELEPGDHVEVIQAMDVTALSFIRASVDLNVPGSLPLTLEWEVSLVVAGAKRARARVTAGRKRRLTDLTANVSKLSGVHAVGVRLELVSS
jgi:hypothetical protein